MEQFLMWTRRILITQWVGEAYKKLNGTHYDSFRQNCFIKTGCLMTADGSNDDKIIPEGLPDYKIMPPLPFDGPEQITEQDIEPADPEEYMDEEDLETPPESDLSESEDALPSERIDSTKDRNYSEPLVGRKIRALYEDGWHVGSLDYFNTEFQQYHISFEGSTEDDYMKPEEIDGIEMVLLS